MYPWHPRGSGDFLPMALLKNSFTEGFIKEVIYLKKLLKELLKELVKQ